MKKRVKRKKLRECRPREIWYEMKEIIRKYGFRFVNTAKFLDIESLARGLESGLESIPQFSIAQAAKFIYLCNLGVTLAEKTVGKRSYLKLKIREIKHEAIKNCQKMNLPIEVVGSKGKLVTYQLDHYRFHAPARL